MKKTFVLFILLLVSCSKPDDIEIVSEPYFMNKGMNEFGILEYEIKHHNTYKNGYYTSPGRSENNGKSWVAFAKLDCGTIKVKYRTNESQMIFREANFVRDIDFVDDDLIIEFNTDEFGLLKGKFCFNPLFCE